MKTHILHHLMIPLNGENIDAKKNRDSDSGKSKRRGIPCHKGASQKFTSTSHHTSDKCPKCDSIDITQTKIHKRMMVEIPKPVPYITTKHILYQYNCKNCSDNFQTNGNLPPCKSFDGSAIREITSLFSKKMPYDTIRETLHERYGLKISNTTVQSILHNGGVMLEPLYDIIHSEIMTEKILGMDETTFLID